MTPLPRILPSESFRVAGYGQRVRMDARFVRDTQVDLCPQPNSVGTSGLGRRPGELLFWSKRAGVTAAVGRTVADGLDQMTLLFSLGGSPMASDQPCNRRSWRNFLQDRNYGVPLGCRSKSGVLDAGTFRHSQWGHHTQERGSNVSWSYELMPTSPSKSLSTNDFGVLTDIRSCNRRENRSDEYRVSVLPASFNLYLKWYRARWLKRVFAIDMNCPVCQQGRLRIIARLWREASSRKYYGI